MNQHFNINGQILSIYRSYASVTLILRPDWGTGPRIRCITRFQKTNACLYVAEIDDATPEADRTKRYLKASLRMLNKAFPPAVT
jgi:hypothetical protein